MSGPDLAAKVAFLGRRDAYPETPQAVERIETHMSWVFLTERHAWKLKKPVHWDSLDFRSLELRRRDCEEEVRLNRRLAGDVYLGTVPLVLAPGGTLRLGGDGHVVDWLVQMRRLPADRMLDALILRGALREADVRPAAERLAAFYGRAQPVEQTPPAYLKRLEEGVRSDLQELCDPDFGLPAERVVHVAEAQLRFLEQRRDLFAQRVHEGRIVEGHGDLRPEHVCLTDEPAIIDCLEFWRELRIVDPADELAFLALECERLGRPEVGGWFLAAYARITRDAPPVPLLAFHRAYRALRRAKIAAWHLRDPEVRDHGRWRERAREYLDLATKTQPER